MHTVSSKIDLAGAIAKQLAKLLNLAFCLPFSSAATKASPKGHQVPYKSKSRLAALHLAEDMNSLESLALKDSPLPSVKVQSLVIMTILNSFMRRSAQSTRIMGTLLGEFNKDGSVLVTDCFAVPFSENLEDLTVKITKDYQKTMCAYHRRNNKREGIVGWFSTTTAHGELINNNSALIHDFYADLCDNPLHLVVDTTLYGDKMQVRGFYGRNLKMGTQVLAKSFAEVKVHVLVSDGEASCLSLLSKSGVAAKSAPTILTATLPSSSQRLDTSLEQLQQLVQKLLKYVEQVVEGKLQGSRELGVQIMQVLQSHAGQVLGAEQVAALQTRYQDLLMQAYLSSLTKTQTLVAQKLNQIL